MLIRMLIFMIPFAFLSWLWYSGTSGRSPQQSHTLETYAKPNEAKIRSALAEALENRACLPTVAFPYDSSESPRSCDICDKLVDAGLLEKFVGTAAQGEREVVAVRYELTATGRPLYTEALRQGRSDGRDGRRPGLCFGHGVIGTMELWTPNVVTNMMVDVRYVPKIENPHELLYGPHARALGLPQLARGVSGDAALPMEYLCATLDLKGVFTGALDGTNMTVNGVPRC